MDDMKHSVDETPTYVRDMLVWIFAFMAIFCLAVCAAGCDDVAGRTRTMDSTADTQARTHHDFNVRCRNMSPLELLECITHRHGDSK